MILWIQTHYLTASFLVHGLGPHACHLVAERLKGTWYLLSYRIHFLGLRKEDVAARGPASLHLPLLGWYCDMSLTLEERLGDGDLSFHCFDGRERYGRRGLGIGTISAKIY